MRGPEGVVAGDRMTSRSPERQHQEGEVSHGSCRMV
jgi:hypothetical protein